MLTRFFEYRSSLLVYGSLIFSLTMGQVVMPSFLKAQSCTTDCEECGSLTPLAIGAATLGIIAGAIAGGYIGEQNRRHSRSGSSGTSGPSFSFPVVDRTLDVTFSAILDPVCEPTEPTTPLQLAAQIIQPDGTIIDVGVLNQGDVLSYTLGPPIESGNYRVVLTIISGDSLNDVTITVNGTPYLRLMGQCNGIRANQSDQFIVDYTIP